MILYQRSAHNHIFPKKKHQNRLKYEPTKEDQIMKFRIEDLCKSIFVDMSYLLKVLLQIHKNSKLFEIGYDLKTNMK